MRGPPWPHSWAFSPPPSPASPPPEPAVPSPQQQRRSARALPDRYSSRIPLPISYYVEETPFSTSCSGGDSGSGSLTSNRSTSSLTILIPHLGPDAWRSRGSGTGSSSPAVVVKGHSVRAFPEQARGVGGTRSRGNLWLQPRWGCSGGLPLSSQSLPDVPLPSRWAKSSRAARSTRSRGVTMWPTPPVSAASRDRKRS